jgi:hypothetical protein
MAPVLADEDVTPEYVPALAVPARLHQSTVPSMASPKRALALAWCAKPTWKQLGDPTDLRGCSKIDKCKSNVWSRSSPNACPIVLTALPALPNQSSVHAVRVSREGLEAIAQRSLPACTNDCGQGKAGRSDCVCGCVCNSGVDLVRGICALPRPGATNMPCIAATKYMCLGM